MKFSQLAPPEPARILTLPPSAWHASYGKRPAGDVALGLRLPSEADVLAAHAEASKEADASGRTGEARAFRFNEALVVWLLAATLCDPNEARKPYFERADEEVREALTPEALRHLWHQLEEAQLSLSPVRPLATDEEAGELGLELLDGDCLAALPTPQATRLRRLLRFCLDELRSADPSP